MQIIFVHFYIYEDHIIFNCDNIAQDRQERPNIETDLVSREVLDGVREPDKSVLHPLHLGGPRGLPGLEGVE